MPVISISLLSSGHADSLRGELPQQRHLSVSISASCQCPINATYQCLPVPINATYQCPSELPFSATYQCQSVPPISAA
ncbi:unnamed protein product [Staurois parvus]|uniref:Uncharacterized protein n=1 Tax=Staurois parvus TaxID=386267 RepID=A0ABN9AC71_9NEOB|nr:unnamed protein product [Staurois parvus]